MLLGCHLSIAKGFAAAVDEAESLGATALQIFSHNASSWTMKPLSPEEAARFRSRRAASPIEYVAIHTMYLLNLATPDDGLFSRSVEALAEELRRGEALAVDSVVTHVGATKGGGVRKGEARVAAALGQAFEEARVSESSRLALLLENTAGSGTTLGRSFAELGEILRLAGAGNRLGVCLDTCHAFAAGYDLRTQDGLEKTLVELDREVGLRRLGLVHLNDSRFPLGSRRDRHEHLGQGEISREGLSLVLNDPRLRDLPFILETPKKTDGQRDADPLNLRRARALRRKGEAR